MAQFHTFALLITLLLSIPTTYSQSNTHHPDFTQNEYTRRVSEDNPINEILFTVEATDPDNHAITYGIEGNAHGYFELGETTGDLILRNPLDREVVTTLDFNVIAVDQGPGPQTSTARVVIIVDDVNDNKPDFVLFPPISIDEDQAPVMFLGTFEATDADSGTNAQVTYSISGDPNNTFSISYLDGRLYQNKTVDFEVNREISIIIVATDQGNPPQFRERGLVITINNVDDTPPIFLNTPYTVSIPESSAVGTTFFTDVLAMDQDFGGTNAFTYTIQSSTGNGATRFSMDSTSGAISVAMALDFETHPSYAVVIHAQEITSVNIGLQTVTTTVTITIIDVNDEPPVLPATVVGEAAESIEIGQFVLQLTYTDPDTVVNDYVFTVLTSGAKFAVSNTGVITVMSTLDHETLPTEVFTVQMCEAINSALCDTTSVSVTVTDENDNSPVFTPAVFTASITEEMNNANILTITATDADDGVFGMVRYNITGTLEASFSVDANGQIDNIAPIDRETDPIVVLTYTATDLDPDFPRQTSVPLTITVDDINDQTPVFLSIPSPCTFDISESVNNEDVFTFSVSDDDEAGMPNALALVEVNNTDFAVSGTHPLFTLMTSGALDREMTPSYTLLLRATDQGTSPLSSDITCTVTVTDVNDQTPSFPSSPYSVTLKENMAVQTLVVTASGTDNDIGANARLTYEIELGNSEGLFSINSSTGAIFLQNSLDHETTTSYTLQVIAIDSAVSPLTGTGMVSITVTDVNDNIPVFGQIRYTMTITEGSAVTTVVGAITATDGDSTSPNKDITFSIQAGNTGTAFELTASGDIRVLVPPIFDTTPSYTLTLVVIDMGTDPQPLSSTTTVEITVIDTNNNDPVLINTPYNFTVTEGTHADTPVGLVSASDVDSDTVTNLIFSLTFPSSALPFAIDSSSGLITITTNTIDRETTPLFTFTVIVEDNTVSPRQDSETVTVQVVDVNDNHPVFMSTPYSGIIDENSIANVPVGVTVTATDGDIGTNADITYFIIGGDKNTHFKIDSSTGVITTTSNPIDFEEIGTPVVLTIEARDGGIPSRATDITVSIAITDLNDNPPTFLGTPYSTTVAENTATGTIVFTAIINDADTTTITLTIISGDTANVFRTNGMNVILQTTLDRETGPSYSLVIQANDSIATITATLTITVSDVNDNDPVIAASNPASFYLPENRSPSTITTISVTDGDIGVNEDIYYELTNTFGAVFSISQTGGVLSQIRPFDFDTTETYMLEIIVRDGGIVSRSATHSITITIKDLNDNTPTFTSDLYREDIDESETVPYTFISNTMATDGDTNATSNGLLTFSIVSVSPASFFNSFDIAMLTGQLTLLNSLDYEVVQEIVLNIMAIDNAVSVGDRLSSTTEVILTINDVNDNTPAFLSSIYRITIFENSNVPSTVGAFTARDIDSGANGAITYSNSGMPSNFDYSSTTGVLTLNTNFDRDTLSPNPFMFMVIATDGGSSPRQNSSTVIVEILDLNDNAPMFNMASYLFSISEGTTFPIPAGTVLATETNDQGVNAQIEYAITHGGEGNFVINATTGEITTTRALDRETEDTFELTVVAYDLGTNPLSTYVAVTITLDDINDNPPVFSFPTYHLNVTEGAANMEAFSSVDIIATDPDMGTNGQVLYSIRDTNFTATTISGLLAKVESSVSLDFETTPHYQIEILAIDQATTGKMTGTATLFITLIDVNDNPPIIMPLSPQTFSEATSGGSFLFQVIATDADSGINAEIQYSITAGNIGTKFSIQEDSGVVTTTTSPLDFETLTSYTLTVTATDRGTPPMSNTLMVQIDITDSNDNAPMFGSDPFTFTAPENDASLTFSVPATDDDSSSDFKQIFYSIRIGDEDGLFVINNMTGEISLSELLDRERPGLEILPSGNGLHRLVVQAQDKNRTEFTATTHVQISVIDSNDNHPSINRECPISLNVQEEVTVHEELLTTIPVTDADFGAAGEFTYVIAIGNPVPRVFRVNQTGTLEVFGTLLDREIQPFHLLQLELRDMGSPPLTSTCMINVTVLDSNTHDPIFANEPNMVIPEDTAINTFLLIYTATDEDIGLNGDIIYTINSGNFGTKFKLGQFDGNLTVIGTLDFETLKFYSLEILAIDRGTPPRTGTGMITINITDVNDNAPVLVENTATSIREDISNGVPIYTAIATDADSDANQMIEYRILDGNGGMIFALNLNTGELTINDNSPINREVRDEYVLTISARDKGTPPLEDILNLTITVTDFNDETPFFLDQNLAFAIIEDTVENNYTGQIIITLTGNDSDIGLNGEFTFRIDNGNRGGSFSLSSDGVLTRLLSIDRETFDDFNLTITIVDKGTPQLSSSMFVYIDITDTNDNTPIFSNMTYTFSTFENAVLTTVIGNVGATDQDEGTNMMIVYVIPDNTIPFSVDPSTGMLSVSSILDRETQDVYSFDIEGYDGGINPRTGTTTVNVNILDVNDNQPYFIAKSYDFTIPENYPITDTFDFVVGTDSDIAPNNVLYYHVLDGSNHTMVGLNSGLLSVVRNLDRESADSVVTGSILVTNTASLPNPSVYNYTFSRTEISITLTDRNDNPPIFTKPWYRRGVISTTEYESVIEQVFANDADLVNSTYFGGEIRFTPDPSRVNTNRFRLDGTNGNIHVFRDLVPDVGLYFDLHVIASDNRLLTPHFNATTRVTLWVITADLQIVITIQQTKPEVEMNINGITEILENITQSFINIDQVVYNSANNEHTDIYFHAVDKGSLGIVSRDSVIRVVDENRITVGSLLKDISVSEVKPATSPVILLDPVLLTISIVLAFLVVICCCLLILCIIYDQVRRKQLKHRQRVSLLKSYDASLDYNYSLSGQTYENPMWLHPYEQWEKEDEFTKGNPLFYESQEFMMDMFRESDDEKSEETVSFGSWGASQAKMRARAGISGMSKASTLTRMSDVDQDYNVELLAEVLGDDLPPSGDEPSEISNI